MVSSKILKRICEVFADMAICRQVRSLNEYRQFFGMAPHKTFEDVNTDSDIQDALRTLYEHPDMIELYPGIFCEGDGRKAEPPVKYKAGYGLWSGIFFDAVTLVRSDRFYTVVSKVSSVVITIRANTCRIGR